MGNIWALHLSLISLTSTWLHPRHWALVIIHRARYCGIYPHNTSSPPLSTFQRPHHYSHALYIVDQAEIIRQRRHGIARYCTKYLREFVNFSFTSTLKLSPTNITSVSVEFIDCLLSVSKIQSNETKSVLLGRHCFQIQIQIQKTFIYQRISREG